MVEEMIESAKAMNFTAAMLARQMEPSNCAVQCRPPPCYPMNPQMGQMYNNMGSMGQMYNMGQAGGMPPMGFRPMGPAGYRPPMYPPYGPSAPHHVFGTPCSERKLIADMDREERCKEICREKKAREKAAREKDRSGKCCSERRRKKKRRRSNSSSRKERKKKSRSPTPSDSSSSSKSDQSAD